MLSIIDWCRIKCSQPCWLSNVLYAWYCHVILSQVSSLSTSPPYEIKSVKVNELSHAASLPKSANNTSRLSKGLPRVSKGPSRISSSPFRVNKNHFKLGPSKSEAAVPAPTTTTAYHFDDNFLYSQKDFQPSTVKITMVSAYALMS